MSSLVTGRKVVASAGTREALTSTNVRGVVSITAETDNTNPVTVGGAAVVGALATRQGTPLAAGDTMVLGTATSPVSTNDVWLDAVTSTEGVTYTVWVP